jgi:UDP-N-acetylmuramoylalanine--D-glutamate ligase
MYKNKAETKTKLWGLDSLRDKRVLVVGMVRSGIAAARLLLAQGASPILNDLKPRGQLNGLDEFDGQPVEWALGQDAGEYLDRTNLVVISPGVPIDNPWIIKARSLGIPVIGELELGARFADGPQAAITGTNGKTTTTALLGEMLRNAGKTVHVAGNIGNPITAAAVTGRPGDNYVIEVSSFQMESAPTLHPQVGALLNITPDHLNRHGDMETYIGLKRKMFQHMTSGDTAVVNGDDPAAVKALDGLPMRLLQFSRKRDVEQGAFIRDGEVALRLDGAAKPIIAVDEIKIPGGHNVENAMAAVCMAAVMGLPLPVIRHTLRTFPGVEHRIETIRVLDGVTYINDSKGTNVDSTLAAISAMSRPTVIILGGYDKHVSFDELAAAMVNNPHIRHAVLIGDTAAQIRESLARAGFSSAADAGYNFDDAISKSRGLAESGWNVLLSPACASFDMFHDYEHRGHEFRRIVEGLS